jgi:small-conductance mechanosensitive channel/CRP-like cAMP-binding protein
MRHGNSKRRLRAPRTEMAMTSDLITTVAMIAREPLIGGSALIAFGAAVSRMLFKQKPMWHAVARVIFLVLLTLLLLNHAIVPYQPLQLTGAPYRDTIAGILKIAWWLWAAWFLVALTRAVVIFEGRPRDGRLVQDILSALIYLTAAFAIIAYVFDLPIQGLLATSGVVAIVLGLALQSSLNDVFSGLVLSLSHPYKAGDWIKIDGGTEGRIVELNWRATHILTGRQDLAIVPNSTIAKSKIVNLDYPSAIHGITVEVRLSAPPATGKNILELALLNSQLILAFPRPSVLTQSIDAMQTEFEITFFVDRLDSDTDAQNELFDLISRHAIAAGARLAPPKNAPYQPRDDSALNINDLSSDTVLTLAGIFVGLMPDERTAIAAKLKKISYEKGDVLVKPDDVLESLFIVGSGVLSVTRPDNIAEKEWLRFGPGDYFGEMGLLASKRATANITAVAPSTVYELTKEDLKPILEARPEIAQELSRAMAERLETGRGLTTAELDRTLPTRGSSAWFSHHIHRLFDLRITN